jgi:putative transposase
MADADLDALRRLTRLKDYAPIHLRLCAVILAAEGGADQEIAEELGHWPAWVRRWRRRFEAEGIDGLWDRRRSGQPTKLARDREKAFIARVLAGPRPKDIVAVWRGKDLQRVLEEEFAARYTLMGVYRLLRRLKLSWLCVRPRHPKSDREAAERFRDEAPLLSRRSRRGTRTKSSSPGARTRRARGSTGR